MINTPLQRHSGSQCRTGSGERLRTSRHLQRRTSDGALLARLTRRLVALGGALVLTAGLVIAVAPAASAADSTTYLDGVTRVGDVAVGGGKVFVAGDDRIVVADTRGALTDVITGLSGALGLAITSDGTRLYAALSGSNEVAEIDTATLTVIRRIDLAAYPCPRNLSLSGSQLWVGQGCDNGTGGVLGLDLSATTPEPVRIASRMYRAPLVAAAGNTLVVSESGLSDVDLMVYDVSVTPPTLRGIADDSMDPMSYLNDLAITPDGSMAIVAFGSHGYQGWDTTSLTKVRTYGAEPTFTGYSAAVAISPDGAHVAGGRSSGIDVTLYDAETTAKTHTNDSSVGEPVAGSLTFSGNDLFGVLMDTHTRQHYLWRLPDVNLPASTLTLTAPYTATALEPLTLTGRLTLANGSAPGAQPVVVTRQLPDGSREPLAAVTTAADGTFTITDTPPVIGTIRYDALWDGSSDFRWSRASTTVTVAKATSSISLLPPSTATAFEPLTLTGRLTGVNGAALGAQRLVVTRDLPTLPREPLPAVTTAADGTFTITDAPSVGGIASYEVYWPGDSLYELAIVSKSVLVAKVQTVLTLSGPETAVAGKQLELSGALDGNGRHPSGARVTALRTVLNRDGSTVTTPLSSVPLSSDGSFRFADTPEEGGEYTYTVKWAGDVTFMPAEGSHVVTVRGGVS